MKLLTKALLNYRDIMHDYPELMHEFPDTVKVDYLLLHYLELKTER